MDRQSAIPCDEHRGEFVTNFCCNFECLKPLCPECIYSHYALHQQNGTSAQIDSIKNVRRNCSKKINGAVIQLNGEKDKLSTHF